MKLIVEWTTKSGERVTNQLYTIEAIENKLSQLETEQATDVLIKSIDTE